MTRAEAIAAGLEIVDRRPYAYNPRSEAEHCKPHHAVLTPLEEQLLAALQSVEQVFDDEEACSCPSCKAPEGHYAKCVLFAAIAAAQEAIR